eukprot:gnl/MRDRNA2_/MRDRNA2_145780_c0_seq1.p1 gnl/MRDRNA2_/MRDRNA2_145780_c0~~gnl/MRDRNA2_/MRDRNA2_145780_c0_seq1.p1  ORF type:complete len:530 (-),score=76.05 gnl/MRDRNA2_/MRDRNA2_145780_c0_seq1:16-1605(-)
MSSTLFHPGPQKLSDYAKDLELTLDSIRMHVGGRKDQLPIDHPLELMYLTVWWLSLALAAYGAMVVGILIWMICVLYRVRLRFQQLLVYQEKESGERLCRSAFMVCTCAFPVATVGLMLAALLLMVASSPRLAQLCDDAEAGHLLRPLFGSGLKMSDAERFMEACLAGDAIPRPLVKSIQGSDYFALWESPGPVAVQAKWSPLDPFALSELAKDADPSRALHWSHFVHVDLTGHLPQDLHITSADVHGEDPPGLVAYARRLNDHWHASGQNPNISWTFASAPPPQIKCATSTATTTVQAVKGKTSNATNTSNISRANCVNSSNRTASSCTTFVSPPLPSCGTTIVRQVFAKEGVVQSPDYEEFWHLGEEMRQLFIIARQKEGLRTAFFDPVGSLPQFLAWHVRRANAGFARLATEIAAIQHVLGARDTEKNLQSSLEAVQRLLTSGFDCHVLKQAIGQAMDPVCDHRKGALVMLWVSGILVMVLSAVVSVVGVLGFFMADGMREDKVQVASSQVARMEARRSVPVDPLF